MKSYLSLIPISARMHRRQNRMTLSCIIFSVFLVTDIFTLADMGIRMERIRLLEKHEGLTMQDMAGTTMGQTLFPIAALLSVLILFAGVLMISGSINSNVAQRTRFFGMMRCIGMSKKQIILFVRLEALNWCRTAIPTGVVLGTAASWAACAGLRFLVREEFSQIPLFGISPTGIASGSIMGVLTVLIAAGAPARRASRVSPVTAVSGNAYTSAPVHRAAGTRFLPIETSLGIHHAVSARKNLLLMTGSFALSIILFLSFSVLVDCVQYLMPQLSSTPDLHISADSGGNSVDGTLAENLRHIDGVRQVYGRRSAFGLPMRTAEDASVQSCDLISFDEYDLDCLAKDGLLKRGSKISKVYGDSGCVLAVLSEDSLLEPGDSIWIGEEELEIAGLLKYDLFSSDGSAGDTVTLIASGDTFTRLTDASGYSLLMVQLDRDAGDETVEKVRQAVSNQYAFHDDRGQSTAGTYTAFLFFVYGFLIIIALVAALNIINSISMSVSARAEQYSAMRAVGMDERQIAGMIAAEAFTYACSGYATGCAAGLLLHRSLYRILIETHFPQAAYAFPAASLLIILLFVAGSTAVAVYGPVKRVCQCSVITGTWGQ